MAVSIELDCRADSALTMKAELTTEKSPTYSFAFRYTNETVKKKVPTKISCTSRVLLYWPKKSLSACFAIRSYTVQKRVLTMPPSDAAEERSGFNISSNVA